MQEKFSYKLLRKEGYNQKDIDNWFDPEYWMGLKSWTAPVPHRIIIRTLHEPN